MATPRPNADNPSRRPGDALRPRVSTARGGISCPAAWSAGCTILARLLGAWGFFLLVALAAGCKSTDHMPGQRGDGALTGPFGPLGGLLRGVLHAVGLMSPEKPDPTNAMLETAVGFLAPIAAVSGIAAAVLFGLSLFRAGWLPIAVPGSAAINLAIVSGAALLTIGLVQWYGPLCVLVVFLALAGYAAVTGWQLFTRWRTKRRADRLILAGRKHEAMALYRTLDKTADLLPERAKAIEHAQQNGGGTVVLGERARVKVPPAAAKEA